VKTVLSAVCAAALLSLPAVAAARAPADAAAKPTALTGVTVAVPRRPALSELTVSPPRKCLEPRRPADPQVPPPRVVGAFPAPGAMVRPGILVLRVTFDLPMSCEGSFAAALPLHNPCPGGVHDMLLTYDRRTFRTVCILEKNAHYGLWLNQTIFHRFTSLAGRSSQAYEITFSTSSEPAVDNVRDALAEDPGVELDAPDGASKGAPSPAAGPPATPAPAAGAGSGG
jgi:hypothetical protein